MTQEEAGQILPGHTVIHRGDRIKVAEVVRGEASTSFRLPGRGMVLADDCYTTDDKVASLMVTFGIFPLTSHQADLMRSSGLVYKVGRAGRQDDYRPMPHAKLNDIRQLIKDVLGKNV